MNKVQLFWKSGLVTQVGFQTLKECKEYLETYKANKGVCGYRIKVSHGLNWRIKRRKAVQAFEQYMDILSHRLKGKVAYREQSNRLGMEEKQAFDLFMGGK